MFEKTQHLLLAGVFLLLVGLSAWLQFGLLEPPEVEPSEEEKNSADYYIEHFVSTGMDKAGKKYEVRADRMVHYPVGDRALLDNPHIVQYGLDSTPRHIYADSGWLFNETSQVLMTGNVKVVQSQTDASGGASMGDKLLVHLNERKL